MLYIQAVICRTRYRSWYWSLKVSSLSTSLDGLCIVTVICIICSQKTKDNSLMQLTSAKPSDFLRFLRYAYTFTHVQCIWQQKRWEKSSLLFSLCCYGNADLSDHFEEGLWFGVPHFIISVSKFETMLCFALCLNPSKSCSLVFGFILNLSICRMIPTCYDPLKLAMHRDA